MTSRTLRLLIGPALAMLAAACTKDPDALGPDSSDRVPASLEILGAAQGIPYENATLGARVRDSAGDTLSGIAVSWSSSDTTRVRVSAAGVVTPLRVGTVLLIASAGNLRDTLVFVSRLRGVGFVFADTVPEVERRLIQDAIQDGLAFQDKVFEYGLIEGPGDSITVAGVYMAAGCAQGGAAAFAGGRTVTFCLGNPGWKTHGPGIRQKIVHHELFHLWQFAFWSEDPAKSPAWLVEGAAELMGFYGVADRGLLTFSVALGCQRKESADFATRQPPGLPPLQNVESRQSFQATQGPLYTHAMLAADYLANEGDGLAAFETFAGIVRMNASWQTAFEAAFKITPAAFYAAFPGYVSGLPVPAAYDCRI